MNIYVPCCDEASREISSLKAHMTKNANQHGRWKVDTIDFSGNIVDTTEKDFVEPSFYETEMHR